MSGETSPIRLFTIHEPPEPIELGELVMVAHVEAADIVRDLLERWRNLTGGHMTRYRHLLNSAMAEARSLFCKKLEAEGYHGAVGIRIAHPNIVEGGAEIIIYGTGFRWKTPSG